MEEQGHGSSTLKHKVATDSNRVASVVVFSDTAYVTREAFVRSQKGFNRLLVPIEAHQIDEYSVQASVYGQGRILGVQYKRVPAKEASQDELRTLEDEKRSIEHEKRKLEDEKSVREKQKVFLDSFLLFADKEISDELRTKFPEPAQLKEMLSFLSDSYSDVFTGLTEDAKRIDQISRDLRYVERRIKQHKRSDNWQAQGIEVLFEADEEQELRIEASYLVMEASWEPVYKLDVPHDLSQAMLSLDALIKQTTGENWGEVHLSVSNAVPLKGAALPEPSVWSLSIYQPPTWETPVVGSRHQRMRAKAAPAEMLSTGAMDLGDAVLESLEEAEPIPSAPPPAETQQAEQHELGLSFEYELPHPVDAGSGDGETMLPLFSREVKGEFFLYVVPRLDAKAYLVCRSQGDQSLLEGKLQIYFGGRFVGETHLPEKRAGDDFLANLGVERGVKIQREKVHDKTVDSLLGKVGNMGIVRELRYRITIENLKQEVASVHLLDCIPVSDSDRIQIKDVSLKPEPTEKDYRERKGIMLWRLKIQPGETEEVQIGFSVRSPMGEHISGL